MKAKRCGRWVRLGMLMLALLGATPLAAADRMRAASGGFGTAINALVPGAYHAKVFQKYGLEVEYIALDSGTLGMQTLLANEIQVLFTTGALPVTSNLQGGDVSIIAGGINFFPFKLIVRPEIKHPAELKGKSVAISRFGSASDFAAAAALEKFGVGAKQVTMLQLGGNPSRLAGLTGGSVAATVFSEPYASMAVQKFGMREVYDLADSGIPFPQNCFMVRRSYLAENRPKVVNFMKAVIEGLYVLKRDKPAAIRDQALPPHRRGRDGGDRLRLLSRAARRRHPRAAGPKRARDGDRRRGEDEPEGERADARVAEAFGFERARRDQEERLRREGETVVKSR